MLYRPRVVRLPSWQSRKQAPRRSVPIGQCRKLLQHPLCDRANALQIRSTQSGRREGSHFIGPTSIRVATAPRPERSMSFDNLAVTIRTRSTQSARWDDLEEAILLQQEALEPLPAPHSIYQEPCRRRSRKMICSISSTRESGRGHFSTAGGT